MRAMYVRREGAPFMRCWHAASVVALAVAAGFGAAAGEDWPPFVDQLIAQLEATPKKNPPASIWRYAYHGRAVFYIPPSCCDIPSRLYDAAGNFLCSPDGGIRGIGDGKCRDFFAARTDEHLLWTDAR